MTNQQIIQWLQIFAAKIEQNKEYLTELDAAIGDADHGINMDRGFKKVMSQLPSVANQDIGNILKTVSMTLISSVGGASGSLCRYPQQASGKAGWVANCQAASINQSLSASNDP